MPEKLKENLISDREYSLLAEISENEELSQRELAKKLGLSLGSVNVLMGKMIKEGLIKMEQVSQKQILYMLTPAGIKEKTKKTILYIKGHYRAIYTTKETLKNIVEEFLRKYSFVYILFGEEEMDHILKVAISEIDSHKKSNLNIIKSPTLGVNIKTNNSVLAHLGRKEIAQNVKEGQNQLAVIDLLDRL